MDVMDIDSSVMRSSLEDFRLIVEHLLCTALTGKPYSLLGLVLVPVGFVSLKRSKVL
jgi:hypothetical protein